MTRDELADEVESCWFDLKCRTAYLKRLSRELRKSGHVLSAGIAERAQALVEEAGELLDSLRREA